MYYLEFEERLATSILIFAEAIVLFVIIRIDWYYKTEWLKKQEDKTVKVPKQVSLLLIFVSFLVSLLGNYLIYVLYYASNESNYMNYILFINSIGIVVIMAIVLPILKPKKMK